MNRAAEHMGGRLDLGSSGGGFYETSKNKVPTKFPRIPTARATVVSIFGLSIQFYYDLLKKTKRSVDFKKVMTTYKISSKIFFLEIWEISKFFEIKIFSIFKGNFD